MRNMMRFGARLIALGLWVLTAGSAAAQTYTTSVTTAPDLGKVVSASTGDTVFTIDESTGVVTRASGAGVRLTTGTTRAAISVRCGNQGTCNNTLVAVKIGAIGTPTKRARALTNFTVAMGTATLLTGPSGSSPITFYLAAIPKNTARTFYVAFDFPIAGDNSGLASGAATSGFYVYVSKVSSLPTTGVTATAAANVFRPIAISNPTSLVFGTVVRPRTGSGSVVINASTAARTVSGGVAALSTPAPSRASFTVTGEGGQAFSVSMPSTLIMTTTGASLTVALTTSAGPSQVLSSAVGSAGTYSFGVGGSLPVTSTTRTGSFKGSFAVTVNYN
jgi:hypothetical protein